jgi:hypothetical protein
MLRTDSLAHPNGASAASDYGETNRSCVVDSGAIPCEHK